MCQCRGPLVALPQPVFRGGQRLSDRIVRRSMGRAGTAPARLGGAGGRGRSAWGKRP